MAATWTDSEVAILRAMWASHRAREIAAKVGRTACAVIGKANRLGLPPISREQRNERIRVAYREWSGRHATA